MKTFLEICQEEDGGGGDVGADPNGNTATGPGFARYDPFLNSKRKKLPKIYRRKKPVI